MAHAKKMLQDQMGFPGQRQSVNAWGVGCSVRWGDDQSRVLTRKKGKRDAVTSSARHTTRTFSACGIPAALFTSLYPTLSLFIYLFISGSASFSNLVTLMSNRIGVSPRPNGGRLKLVRGRSTARCPPLSNPGQYKKIKYMSHKQTGQIIHQAEHNQKKVSTEKLCYAPSQRMTSPVSGLSDKDIDCTYIRRGG